MRHESDSSQPPIFTRINNNLRPRMVRQSPTHMREPPADIPELPAQIPESSDLRETPSKIPESPVLVRENTSSHVRESPGVVRGSPTPVREPTSLTPYVVYDVLPPMISCIYAFIASFPTQFPVMRSRYINASFLQGMQVSCLVPTACCKMHQLYNMLALQNNI